MREISCNTLAKEYNQYEAVTARLINITTVMQNNKERLTEHHDYLCGPVPRPATSEEVERVPESFIEDLHRHCRNIETLNEQIGSILQNL